MIAITTHLNADFDCLASMVAAHKLYPEALLLFPGSQEKSVRNYLEKTGFPLPITKYRYIDIKRIKKLVVVDTTSRERLGPLSEICDNPGIEIEVYDHHPESGKDIDNTGGRIEIRGSTTTLMMEILKEKGIEINEEEATLFMLGIYEDTGSLTFTSTTTHDYHQAAWLLTKGANLNIVSDFLQRNLTAEQIALLHQLLGRLEFHPINGVEIAIATTSVKRYIGDLALVVHALKDMENLTALFVLVEMEGRLHLVARSRIAAVDAGQIAASLGGGGHHTAASATVRNMLLEDAKKKLIKVMKKCIPLAPTAKSMMVTPVISVAKNDTLEDVEKILTRYSFNTVPVTENGIIVGLLTRKIIEKALYHKLAKEKAEDYMLTDFMQVSEDAPSEIVKEIVINKKQKLVPVVDENGLSLGIIGRLDVMHAMYSDMIKSPISVSRPEHQVRRYISRDMKGIMKESLPEELFSLLERVANCADKCGYTAYAVGGFVRDLLMRRKNYDLDIVIEGDGIDFAYNYVQRYSGKIKPHKKFHTAVMVIENHRKVDIATARTEYYTEPAALPIVEMSSIKNDMFRRDFTFNALAIKLNGPQKNHLIDFFGGQRDLKDGIIRVLHNLSFVEDPTRIFRALRFEQRFQFVLGGQTAKLLRLAAQKGLMAKVSGARIFGELNLIFKEEHPERIMKRMAEFDIWRFIHSSIDYDDEIHLLCTHAREAINWHSLTFDSEKITRWFIYFLCIMPKANKDHTIELALRLGFTENTAERLLDAKFKVTDVLTKLPDLDMQKPADIFDVFEGLSPEILLTAMAAATDIEHKRIITEYMTRLRFIAPKVRGSDLIKEGVKQGPDLGKVMRAIRRENLKNALPTMEDEIKFARKFYNMLVSKK